MFEQADSLALARARERPKPRIVEEQKMKRTTPALALAISVMMASMVSAQTVLDLSPGAQDTQRVTRSSTLATLARTIPEVDWEDTAFETIVEWLREQGPINVVVRWRALESDGIDRDTEVTLRLRNTTVGQALTYALEQLATTPGDIRYRTFGNALHISTRTDFNQKMYMLVYPVADILRTVPRFTDAPQITLDQQGQGGGGGGGRGGGGGGGIGGGGGGGGGRGGIGQSTGQIFGGGRGGGGQGGRDQDDDDEVDEERMIELIDLITATIEPASWTVGGGLGSIEGFNGRVIVVRNSIEVHEQLGGVIE